MISILSNLFGALCMISLSIYIWKKLLVKKINFKNYRLYIITIISIPVIILNYFFINPFVNMALITIMLMLGNKFLFSETGNKTIVSTILGQIIINIGDMIFGLILVFVFKVDTTYISENLFGSLIANISVCLISFLIINLKIITKIYTRLVTLASKINIISLTNLGILVIASINIMMSLLYYIHGSKYNMIINIILLAIYAYIAYKNISEKNNSVVIKAKNEALIESLSHYESMLDRQRIDNHENKNQLLIIKNMINKNDDGVIKYIDTIIKDEKEDDELLYTKVKKIPSGGLQGIIYQKMLIMKDKNIKFSIDVSKEVRKIDLDNFDAKDNYNLCKIVGALLDNAIEESLNIKDKQIMISLYEEDERLVIDISNKFDGHIDLNNIDNEGYTTKGDGHGYGLSLVKKIVSESSIFINERKVNKNVFKQIIKVKFK